MTSQHFKYTDNDRFLTNEQRQCYEENGYLMFRNLVSHESIDEYRQRFIDICNGKVESGKMTVAKAHILKETTAQGEYLINKIQDFIYDDVLFKFTNDKVVVDIVSSIIGEDITAVHSMLINKPPDSKFSRHPMHQDLHYFPFRPADKICASWTAMERIDEKNGCLFAIPGSHKLKLLPHVYLDEEKSLGYHGVQGYNDEPSVNFIMEKGDTLFFHPILLHGSGPNLTKVNKILRPSNPKLIALSIHCSNLLLLHETETGCHTLSLQTSDRKRYDVLLLTRQFMLWGFRKVISVHYANSNCHFIDVRGTTQQNIADEAENLVKRRGYAVKYQDFFRYKSRLVKGRPGNFQIHPSNL